jgi:hypothetical protein
VVSLGALERNGSQGFEKWRIYSLRRKNSHKERKENCEGRMGQSGVVSAGPQRTHAKNCEGWMGQSGCGEWPFPPRMTHVVMSNSRLTLFLGFFHYFET